MERKHFPLPSDFEMVPIPEGRIPPTDLLYESIYFGNREVAQSYQRMMMKVFSTPDRKRCDHIDGFAILRTTARLAARNSGVPFDIIHKLTQEYRGRAFALTDMNDFEQLSIQFIDDICDEVYRFRTSGYSQTVARCVGIIISGFSSPLKVKEIAQKLEVNPNYLSAQFKRETGKTISNYIQDIRLEYACHLLTIAPLSIADIAGYSGFYDQSHLNRLFSQRYGVTPAEYRIQHRITEA